MCTDIFMVGISGVTGTLSFNNLMSDRNVFQIGESLEAIPWKDTTTVPQQH